jgi:hypothetical protein
MLKYLSEYDKCGVNTAIRGHEIAKLLPKYQSIVDFIQHSKENAIADPLDAGKTPLSHEKLRDFLENGFDLTKFGVPYGTRVSLLLPNGPSLAVAVLCVLSKWCAAPINPMNTWQEIKAELATTQSLAVIILAGEATNKAALLAADSLGA